LNRHDVGDVLQTIVDRSAAVLDARYGELMLIELRERMTPQEIDEILGAIRRVIQKMAGIIDELLLLARVRALETIRFEAFPTAALLAEVEARLATCSSLPHKMSGKKAV
jgi:signal transduction histidine kinase